MKSVVPTFNAKVVERENKIFLQFGNMEALENYLRTLVDKDCYVTIERKRKLRSLNENSYYWGVVVQMVADETGNATEDIHKFLKAKFAPKKRLFDQNIPRTHPNY